SPLLHHFTAPSPPSHLTLSLHDALPIYSSIATVKRALQERSTLLAQSLRTHLPDAQFSQPDGGYFMWVTFPEGVDGDALFEAAAERGVKIVKGSDFLIDDAKNAIRLAYSGVTPDEIDEGVQRLAQAYASL